MVCLWVVFRCGANDRGRCGLGSLDWHMIGAIRHIFWWTSPKACVYIGLSVTASTTLAFGCSHGLGFTGLLGNNVRWTPAPISSSLILQYWRRKPFLLLVYFSWGCTRKHQAVIDHLTFHTAGESEGNQWWETTNSGPHVTFDLLILVILGTTSSSFGHTGMWILNFHL